MKNRSFITLVLILFSAAFLSGEEVFSGWVQTETEHFIFIYESKDQEAAQELILECEEVYRQVSGFLGSEPKGPIRCILKSRYDAVYAYSGSPPSHIVLYLSPPKNHTFGTTGQSWLRLLLVHELTHYIHTNYDKGLYAALSRILGKEMRYMDFFYLTSWLVEGLAVNTETSFTAGGRGDSPFFELLYKAPILENRFFSFRKAGFSSDYPPSGREYVAGYLLVNYIQRTYGNYAIQEMLYTFSRFPFFGFARVIKKVTGLSFAQLFADMEEELRNRFEEDAKIEPGTPFVPEQFGDFYNPLRQGESIIIYRETLKKGPAIVAINRKTGEETILSAVRLTDPYSFSISRDGTLVFAASTLNAIHPAGNTYRSDLYIREPETGKEKRITKNQSLWHPALSRDGSKLIAIQGDGTYSRLVEVNPATGETALLYERERSIMFNPVFSPDGSKIAVTVHTGGFQDIWLIDLLDQENQPYRAQPLFRPDPAGDSYPRFLDNGTILFTSDREGSLSLYTLEIGDSRLVPVAVDPVGAFTGFIDGETVVYGTYTSRGYSMKTRRIEETGSALEVEPVLLVQDSLKAEKSTIPASRRYIDLPKPLFWYPLPLIEINTVSPFFTFGGALATLGSGPLGKVDWSLLAGSRFDIFQPEIELSVTWNPGIITLSYVLGQTYADGSGSYTQSFSQSAGLEVPFIARSGMGTTVYADASIILQHLYALSAAEEFDIVESATRDDLSDFSLLLAGAGISGYTKKHGSSFDLYPRAYLGGALYASVPLLPAASFGNGIAYYGELLWTFPSFIKHQVFKLTIQSEFSSISSTAYNAVSPRGLFQNVWGDERGKYLFALDYLIPLALLDSPLFLGFSLHGIGMGLHLETIGGWDVNPGQFTPGRELYTGIEFAFLLESTFFDETAVGIGLSFRFDTSLTEEPDLFFNDLMPYFYIGLDSLSGFFLQIDNR